jgi:hypothetical protein
MRCSSTPVRRESQVCADPVIDCLPPVVACHASKPRKKVPGVRSPCPQGSTVPVLCNVHCSPRSTASQPEQPEIWCRLSTSMAFDGWSQHYKEHRRARHGLQGTCPKLRTTCIACAFPSDLSKDRQDVKPGHRHDKSTIHVAHVHVYSGPVWSD